MNQTFSGNLKSARKENSLTQKELSEKLSVKLSRYQAWEEGRSVPNLELLARICEELHIDDLYLFISAKIFQEA